MQVITLGDWTDPMVIVGTAQLMIAGVLALFTVFLWKATDKYAKLTEKDLKNKEKIKRIDRLGNEMNNIIGPLYSKLDDPIYFNNNSVIWRVYDTPSKRSQQQLRGSKFWRDVKKNLFLTTPKTRHDIKGYLDIKLGIKEFSEEMHPGYQAELKIITDAVNDRYETLTKELDMLENLNEDLN